ncbi:dihydroorotate dehydrogenase [Phaeovulum sp.]|uniref:dihydroorotate dehydrogenase n=1 Tax=Phaeovulum sp. TaxID=2934796 RepID=UPI0039E2A1A1
MDKTDKAHDPLEAFFGAARTAAPEPGMALLARVLADAEAETRARHPLAALAHAPKPRMGGFAALLAALGGWRAVGGLATATLAGVWIGFAGVDRLEDMSAGYLGVGGAEVLGTVDLLPDEDVFAFALGTEDGR